MSGDFDRLNTGDIVRIMLDDGTLQYHVVTTADGKSCATRHANIDDWQAIMPDTAIAEAIQNAPTLVWNGGYPYWEDELPPEVVIKPTFMDTSPEPRLLQFPRTPPAPTPQWLKPYLDAQADSLRKMAAQSGIPLPRLEPVEAPASYDDVLLAYQRYAPPRPVDPNWTPPKRTWRIRFRIWRNETNRRVQQWIHDHLPEAYCDN